MSKRYVADNVFCPYYKSQDRSRIMCEGPDDNSSFHVAFATPEKRRRYMVSYCMTKEYPMCTIAQGRERYWEGK